MRAGTISWIVIPFLLASLAASGLGKPDHHWEKKDARYRQPLRHDPRPPTSGDFLVEKRKYDQIQPNHESANKPLKPISKPLPPLWNPIRKVDIENPHIRGPDDSADNDSKESHCLYNLQNETCSESLYCVITKPAKPNDHPVQSDCEMQAIIRSVTNRTECLQTCLNETAVTFTQCVNRTYLFYPIDSPCNIKVEIVVGGFCDRLGGYKYLIAVALGIISLLILIISIVARKRKLSATKTDKLTESGYKDASNLRPTAEEPTKCEYDYVYDHRRLQEKPKKPEYDDVGDHQRLPEETRKLEYDYVYSHRL